MSEGFLGRWARRKLEVKQQELLAKQSQDIERSLIQSKASPHEEATAHAHGTQTMPVSPGTEQGSTQEDESQAIVLPTEADLESVLNGGEIRSFMNPQVSGDLRNKAFKALFSQPQFNQMDFMDVYVDDYSVSTPLTSAMIDMMALGKQLLSRPDLEAAKQAEEVSNVGSKPRTEGAEAVHEEALIANSAEQLGGPADLTGMGAVLESDVSDPLAVKEGLLTSDKANDQIND